MEDPKEFESIDYQTKVIKRKRSKRHKPTLSPLKSCDTTTVVTTSFSSSNTCDSDDTTGIERRNQEGENGYFSSSTTSTEEEKEQDLANCLILLAQGSSLNQTEQGTSTNNIGKAGLYVYECKTCNRTFPSFQALGGHSASHKKHHKTTSIILIEEKKVPKMPLLADEKVLLKKISHNPSLGLSFQEGGNKKLKVHECSICGCEFTSGQALGGHMRRHRVSSNVIVGINNTTTNISLRNKYNNMMEEQRTMFPLDLNLPAQEDDHRGNKFQFVATHRVFSAPALIDCHY